MMYESKLAAAIKVAGKVLREFDKDKIYLPFGSEYSIFLKNLSTKRALVHVSIDGNDVGDGRGFIVPANESIDIERFITNGNLNEGNRFKFIERTGAIENHRGVGIEDGLIQITFQFEKEIPTFVAPTNPWWVESSWGTVPRPYYGTQPSTVYSANVNSSITPQSVNANVGVLPDEVIRSLSQNETGITAPGSVSDQSFVEAEHFSVESETHTMVFHLLGETESNRSVREAVTVKHKPKCVTCGTVNRYDAKFCSECGTSLQIV